MKALTYKLALFAKVIGTIGSTLLALGCNATPESKPAPFTVVATELHDKSVFTQGFEISNGEFYESAGLYGQSRIRRYLPSGEIIKEFQLPPNEFAEGLTVTEHFVVLLTWQNRKVYFLDKQSLAPIAEHKKTGEGWGAAWDGTSIIVSDGSDVLSFYHPDTFTRQRALQVTGHNRQWQRLNELEFAKGYIWANVWQENLIIAIDPISGMVKHKFDLTALVEKNTRMPWQESLNGIAYDSSRDAFWITGKQWPNRYLVKFDLNQ